jgi:hypothetical protein
LLIHEWLNDLRKLKSGGGVLWLAPLLEDGCLSSLVNEEEEADMVNDVAPSNFPEKLRFNAVEAVEKAG